MGSKSSSIYQSTETNDASQVQGLQAIRGDSNSIAVLDGGAIEQAVGLAKAGVTSNAQTMADVLGTVNTLAGKAIETATAANNRALLTLTDSTKASTSAIQSAYSTAANAGIQPEKLLLILAALGAAVLLLRG